jgi:hypothetical protein
VNTDAKDDIFSLVEVHRGEQELPALRPPTEVRAFPSYAKGTKYGKGEKGEKGEKADKADKAGKSGKEKKGKGKKSDEDTTQE